MTLPSLSTLARRVLTDAGVQRGETIVVACSGGVDSQVLLDVLTHCSKPERGRHHTAPPWFRLVACGVDHGLRPEAKDELALAAELAAARRVPFLSVRVQVAAGSNLQARARDERLAALRRVAAEAGARFIATGHHLDDRAETVLMRILRGAPIQGLAVLPPWSQDLLRPLIHAPRTQIEAHARRRGLAFAVDPSNANHRFLRARVREQVLPMLRSVDPRITEHLVGLADGALSIASGGTDPLCSTSQPTQDAHPPVHGRAGGRVLHSPEEALPDRSPAANSTAHFDGGGVHATRNSRAPLASRPRRVAPVKRQP